MTPARSGRAAVIVGITLVALLGRSLCTGRRGRDPGRRRDDHGPVAATKVAATALWDFTADVLRAVADGRPDTNAVLAPVPISLGLAQAAAGANGATRRQVDDVLHAVEGFDQGLGTLWSELPNRSGSQTNDATGRTGRLSVEFASSLWAQRNTSFEDPWLETLARTWDAGVRETDFRSDPEQARRTVNDWAADATSDHITQLLSRGALDELTRFLATSATYLRAPWSAPFAPSDTRVAEFRRLDGSHDTVPMMRRVDEGAGWAEGAGWQAVTLGVSRRRTRPDGRTTGRGALHRGRACARRRRVDRPPRLDPAASRSTCRSHGSDSPPISIWSIHSAPSVRSMPSTPFSPTSPGSAPTRPSRWRVSPTRHSSPWTRREPRDRGSRPVTTTTTRPTTPRRPATTGRPPDDVDTAPGTATAVPPTVLPSRRIVIDRPFLVIVSDRPTGAPLLYGRVVSPRG